MVQVDLITGFLGAGKTTFLRQYAQELVRQGHNVCILENDLGAVNVDAMLVQDVLGARCDLETISGGCGCDTHQRRLRTKLISMAMRGFDRVLMEPSGVFDPDELFDLLREEPLDRWYQAGNVIAVVDALLEPQLSPQAEYLLAAESACAGLILFSRVGQASVQQLREACAHLDRAWAQAGCARRCAEANLLCKDWAALDAADWARIGSCGHRTGSEVRRPFGAPETFGSLCFLALGLTAPQARRAAEALFADPACGHVLRVKGFVPTAEGWLELNAAAGRFEFQPIPQGQEVLIVTGEALDRAAIEAHWQAARS